MLWKYVAAREKDLRFTRDAARAGLVDRETLLGLLPTLPVDDTARALVRARIEHDFPGA